MIKRVWIFQIKKEVVKKGAAQANWYVGWYDLDSHRHAESCGPGTRGKNLAEKKKRQIEGELDHGVHQPSSKKKWSEFRSEYEEQILSNLAVRSQQQVKIALNHFQRIVRPGYVDQITTKMIDTFIARRRREPGKNPKSRIAAATVNKDLRHIKAVLRVAFDWQYLRKVPKLRMLREPEKLVQYVTQADFAKIYHEATCLAKIPLNAKQSSVAPSVWWKALLATAYMTGWRIRELMAMRAEDLDLQTGTVITRHADNKGKRSEKVPVHPIVIEHLRPLLGTAKFVFQWDHAEEFLWDEFNRIQREVGIHLPCLEEHEHTPACHTYGFHDLRRAFATLNAAGMKPETLQRMMRHKSYKTTLGYINRTKGVDAAIESMHVPETLRPKSASDGSPDGAANVGDDEHQE